MDARAISGANQLTRAQQLRAAALGADFAAVQRLLGQELEAAVAVRLHSGKVMQKSQLRSMTIKRIQRERVELKQALEMLSHAERIECHTHEQV